MEVSVHACSTKLRSSDQIFVDIEGTHIEEETPKTVRTSDQIRKGLFILMNPIYNHQLRSLVLAYGSVRDEVNGRLAVIGKRDLTLDAAVLDDL